MPRFIMKEVDAITVERGHPLLVAPMLDGNLVSEKTRTVWHPPVKCSLFRLGLYLDGHRSSYYWHTRYKIPGLWLRFQLDSRELNSFARVEVVDIDDVPAELWLSFKEKGVRYYPWWESWLFLIGAEDLMKRRVGIEENKLNADLPLLGGQQMLISQSPRRAKWVAPSGKVVQIGRGRFRGYKLFLWKPLDARSVILVMRADGSLTIAQESELTRKAIQIAERDKAWYIET